MKNKEMQIAWMAAGFYTGGIDGDLATKSNKAMHAVRAAYGDTYTFKPHGLKRERIGSVQACLNALEFSVGAVDGYEGHNTREALSGLLYSLVNGGKRESVPRRNVGLVSASKLPKQSQVRKFYGDPNKMAGNLETVELPFKVRIDWSLRQSTNKITVHKKCAPALLKSMIEVREHYGEEGMRELGLDRYAGAYNKRKMRGGSKWSMHAYGCAIDFYAAPNGLRMRCPDALFCGEDYKAFLDIMEGNGWLPAIRLWGADAMHFQAATL